MTRRPGLSLTEVLVALFIMGIGTIAILTLFPLGALNMAQAFRDDRCTQSASQADAFLRNYVKEKRDRGLLIGEKFFTALDDPSNGASPHMPKISTSTSPSRWSYPVVIDPLGYRARGGTNDAPTDPRVLWVGDDGFGDRTTRPTTPHNSALARRSLSLITSRTDTTPPRDVASQQPLALRTCSLLDGFGYDEAGQPSTVGGTVDRDVRYNWLWVVQKPDVALPAANVTVVVFDKRAPNYAPAGAQLETVWIPAQANPGETLVRFNGSYAGVSSDPANPPLPTVQKGGWLLDVSICLLDRQAAGPVPVPFSEAGTPMTPTTEPWIRNAQFYRVVSVTENAGGIDVELESALQADRGWRPGDPAMPTNQRRFIYLAGVAEVFERPQPLDLN